MGGGDRAGRRSEKSISGVGGEVWVLGYQGEFEWPLAFFFFFSKFGYSYNYRWLLGEKKNKADSFLGEAKGVCGLDAQPRGGYERSKVMIDVVSEILLDLSYVCIIEMAV